LALILLGLAMLALGIWVEDRAAVAAPLVIIGALIVVAGVIFEAWADIAEMSVSQGGLTFKRRPSVEQLTEAGLPPKVAEEIQAWMDGILDALPEAIDRRVRKALADQARGARRLQDMAEDLARRRVQSYGDSEVPPE